MRNPCREPRCRRASPVGRITASFLRATPWRIAPQQSPPPRRPPFQCRSANHSGTINADQPVLNSLSHPGVQHSISRCFRCSGRKFTANRISFAAEILESCRFELAKNGEKSAVLLFFAVFGPTIEFRGDDDTNYKVLRPRLGLKSQYQIPVALARLMFDGRIVLQIA
jgi:hypothetical protein